MTNKHEIYIGLEGDCDDAEDAVCIGFDFTCPICGKLSAIQPRGKLADFYYNPLCSWHINKGMLMRCQHCKAKFKTLIECNMLGKTTVEKIEKQGATCYNAEKGE